MIDFFGALRRGDFDAAAALLDPNVHWQGLREEWVADGREHVLQMFRWGLEERREVDGLEFVRGGERVAMGARGPSFTKVEDEPLEGQIFNVYTLRGGRIVRIDDYRGRGEALRAAGVAEDAGWHWSRPPRRDPCHLAVSEGRAALRAASARPGVRGCPHSWHIRGR